MNEGDKVRLNAYGRSLFDDEYVNPHNSIGVISYNDRTDELPLKVMWHGCESNWYGSEHLELVESNSVTYPFQVGETYETDSGSKLKCIYIDDGLAYCVFITGSKPYGPAYTWDMNGVYQCADGITAELYRIKFPPTIKQQQYDVIVDGVAVAINYKTVDGVPDFTDATVVPF